MSAVRLDRDRPTTLLNRDGRCAYFGCARLYQHVRAADSGWQIGYCAQHYTIANQLFGAERKERAA